VLHQPNPNRYRGKNIFKGGTIHPHNKLMGLLVEEW